MPFGTVQFSRQSSTARSPRIRTSSRVGRAGLSLSSLARDMRHFALQMFWRLGALSQAVGTAAYIDELEIMAIFCGVGLDTSLWCLASGWI